MSTADKTLTDWLAKWQTKVAIAVTGGGTAAVPDVAKQGGASAWLADYRVPYSRKALEQLVCNNVETAVSEETARLMAYNVYHNTFSYPAPFPLEDSLHLFNPGSGVPFSRTFGIGVTSKLAYDGERLGRKHLVQAAAYCPVPVFKGDCYLTTFLIPQGETRQDQEKEVELFIKQFLVEVTQPPI